uniref:DUF805 domain-containing protein n=1 Tax=Thaumasiovibrio occultus TaxID=1891184 RepID=UPI000B350954|nr:DUF805 domain-containing protein [Thaumasiovibrio occultus]
MEWYLGVLKQYAVFSGRARRTEYWMFTLFSLIVSIVLTVIDGILNMGILSAVYGLGVLIPTTAVCARRLHDTGRSGWWQLIAFIPLIGIIVLIYFLVQDSVGGDNEYGSNPKADEQVIA